MYDCYMSFNKWTRGGAFALIFLTASVVARSDEGAVLVEYGCTDLVAIGRVKTLNFDEVSLPDNLLGNGRFWMDVSFKKILRGKEGRSGVRATQIAHAQLREDRDFIVVLSPMEIGAYTLKSAHLWKQHPRPTLAKNCAD